MQLIETELDGLIERVKMGQMVCYEIKDEGEVEQVVKILKVDKK